MAKLSITSGEFRGQKIFAPDTSAVHPMGAREKLALFNALESLIGPLSTDLNVLDCYCGSGALGLEALSRGAGRAIFVDQNPTAIATVKQNIATLGVGNRAHVRKEDFSVFVRENSEKSPFFQFFDVIFVDPPYDNFPQNLGQIASLLKNDGILALSHPTSVDPTELLPNFQLIKTKKHAAANLSFLVKHEH